MGLRDVELLPSTAGFAPHVLLIVVEVMALQSVICLKACDWDEQRHALCKDVCASKSFYMADKCYGVRNVAT